jgi:hypothetical protein
MIRNIPIAPEKREGKTDTEAPGVRAAKSGENLVGTTGDCGVVCFAGVSCLYFVIARQQA